MRRDAVRFVRAVHTDEEEEKAGAAAAAGGTPSSAFWKDPRSGEESRALYEGMIKASAANATTTRATNSNAASSAKTTQGHRGQQPAGGGGGRGGGMAVDAKQLARTAFVAAEAGDLSALAQALDRGFDVLSRDAHGWTVLMAAAAAGQSEAVRLLLRRAPSAALLHACDLKGRTAASIASAAGLDDIADELSSWKLPITAATAAAAQANPPSTAAAATGGHRSAAAIKKEASKSPAATTQSTTVSSPSARTNSAGGKRKDDAIVVLDDADDVEAVEPRQSNKPDEKTALSPSSQSSAKRRRASQGEKKEKETAAADEWFCEVCQARVREEPGSHNTSILHNLNCQRPVKADPFLLPSSNKGYQLMVRTGWDEERGLGPEGRHGRLYPVKTVLKRDRLGIGYAEPAKPHLSSSAAAARSSALSASSAASLAPDAASAFPSDLLPSHSRREASSARPSSSSVARVTHFEAFDQAAVARPPAQHLLLGASRREREQQQRRERARDSRLRRYLSEADH
eukprot:m.143882 g.143882  ORF g.143882 m.143882 type:complete len:515 (+) comp16752_c0_seq1:105-1649(+)